MKLFLLKDLKGKGKSGDFIEVKGGYAQFLIRSGTALDYEANKVEIQKIIDAKLDAENDALQLANNIAEELADVNIKLSSKLSPKGSLVNKITKNDIIAQLPVNLKDTITKTMLEMENINTAGIYDIPVKLHRQVTGNIRVTIIGD